MHLRARVRLPSAPEVRGLGDLHKPDLLLFPVRGVRFRIGENLVVVTVPAVVRVIRRGQNVHERRRPVHGVDLVKVVPLRREDAGPALLRVFGGGPQHGAPQSAHLRRGQRRRRLRPAAVPLQPVEAADPDLPVEDFEHAVHARVVVQRDGGAAFQQEHPHAELVRLADVHVGDRRHSVVVRVRPRRAVLGSPRDELQVSRSDFRHQAFQLTVVLYEGLSALLTESWWVPEGDQSLSGYSLDDGSHGTVAWHHPGSGAQLPGSAACC